MLRRAPDRRFLLHPRPGLPPSCPPASVVGSCNAWHCGTLFLLGPPSSGDDGHRLPSPAAESPAWCFPLLDSPCAGIAAGGGGGGAVSRIRPVTSEFGKGLAGATLLRGGGNGWIRSFRAIKPERALKSCWDGGGFPAGPLPASPGGGEEDSAVLEPGWDGNGGGWGGKGGGGGGMK